MGPTTDILRYFPDALYFDRLVRLATWKVGTGPERLPDPADQAESGLFTFFAEFKFSATQRRFPVSGVPVEYVGQIEREALLTYRRLTTENPSWGLYLDGMRARIALFYAASYAPEKLYATWEHLVQPIDVKASIVEPTVRSYETEGSGTPWVNFDIRTMKSLARFLEEDLFWQPLEALAGAKRSLAELFPDYSSKKAEASPAA